MIDFRFSIRMPSVKWEALWSKNGKTPFPNKYWEFTIYHSSDLIVLQTSLRSKSDHAGFNFELGIFGYTVVFDFYDNRHWDSKNNCWDDEV